MINNNNNISKLNYLRRYSNYTGSHIDQILTPYSSVTLLLVYAINGMYAAPPVHYNHVNTVSLVDLEVVGLAIYALD